MTTLEQMIKKEIEELSNQIKQELRDSYHDWKDGGHAEWVALDIISEKYESERYFDDVKWEPLQEEIRKEMESL